MLEKSGKKNEEVKLLKLERKKPCNLMLAYFLWGKVGFLFQVFPYLLLAIFSASGHFFTCCHEVNNTQVLRLSISL